jgi:hypothetical protein
MIGIAIRQMQIELLCAPSCKTTFVHDPLTVYFINGEK